MIYKEHLVELWVNGNKVELENQKSLGVRLNNVLQDPTKISSSQAEYSFEFSVPATPHNNVIFDYANNLSKTNKFHQRYNAELYADGTVIFSGSITVNSYKDGEYKLNLVSVKVFSLDEIFGDMVMTDIAPMTRDSNGNIVSDSDGKPMHSKWDIEYDGIPTMNAINAMENTDVTFPLIAYKTFEKVEVPFDAELPESRPIYHDYTSKFDIDDYNRWFYTDFYPSHKMLTTLKNCFETADYVVGGEVFRDQFLNDVYMSINLADGQVPTYNLGAYKFGVADIFAQWSCPQDTDEESYGNEMELKFPLFKSNADGVTTDGEPYSPKYNFTSIRVYDMMDSTDGGSATAVTATYLFANGDQSVVIPADGWYRITMEVNAALNQSSKITATTWTPRVCGGSLSPHGMTIYYPCKNQDSVQSTIDMLPDFKITTPLEIQLVKNYENDDTTGIGLIKGKHNIRILDGYPDHDTIMGRGFETNYKNWITCFPHQKLGNDSSYFSYPVTETTEFPGERITEVNSSLGYVYADNELMAFDPVVSDKFICGFTTMGSKLGGGTGAVIKNGKSWSKSVSDIESEAFYQQPGYKKGTVLTEDTIEYNNSTVNSNIYPGANYTFSQGDGTMAGTIKCLVYLNRNDVLKLIAVHRDYKKIVDDVEVNVSYATSASVSLKIEAASPAVQSELRNKMENGRYTYDSSSEFDTRLNLANFFNKETKISDWVKGIQDAFNLDIIQNGKTITINTKKKSSDILTAVDIDNRVNSSEAESSRIDYPRSMAVKYKIDTDEWGAEKSAIEANGGDSSVMDRPDWKKFIDSGFTEIILNDDTFETSKSNKTLKNAYTWYDNFRWFKVDYNRVIDTTSDPVTLRTPVISKFTYMVDGYPYEESVKHDGYGLAQRFWFKPKATDCFVWTERVREQMMLYTPSNVKDGLNLSYKNTERSLLTDYFNIKAYLASNYVEVDVYLSPEEYVRIKNGAYVHFDSDIYIPVEISGYDSTGYNPTSLKMMKKVN